MPDSEQVAPVPAIEEAIDHVAAAAPPVPTITLRIVPQGLMIQGGGYLRFSQAPGYGGARMFLYDPAADVWVPIAMVPGDWQIGAARDDSLPPIEPPKIWTPS